MRIRLAALALCIAHIGYFGPAFAQDTDNDGVSDALEAKLGMDPQHPDVFELLHDDKSKEDGDKTIGPALDTAGDFTRIWFCAAAKDRYVWKIEFAKPWAPRGDVATILYVDADNNLETGRKDKSFARGVDMMLRPDGATMFEWPARVRSTSAHEGNILYLAADIALNQDKGKSSYRCWLLTQNTTKGRERDVDNMPPIEVRAAGRSERARPAVPLKHPLYIPPEVISHISARMVPGAPEPTAEILWLTSWSCRARVEYGETEEMKESREAPRDMENHRVFLPVKAGQTYHYRVVGISEDGTPKTSEKMTFKADVPALKGAVERAEIVLTFKNDGERALTAAPFLTGVPFPKGALGDAAHMRLLQDGKEIPLQAECASRWPDGSVKWALAQFQADCPAKAEAAVSLQYGNAVRAALTAPAPMITDKGDVLVCNTGLLQAVVDKNRFTLFREAGFDKNRDGAFSPEEQVIASQAGAGLYLVDGTGKEYVSLQPEEVVIEENGPVRAVVKVRGHHAAQDGSKLFEYIVRLMFYRGHGFVRIFHTFGNSHVRETTTDILRMGLRVPLAGAWASDRIVREQMKYQGGGEAAPPVMLKGDGLHLALDMVNFRELYPKRLVCENRTLDIQICPSFDPKEYEIADPVVSDRLYYYLRDGVYRLRCGISKTHEIFMGFGGEETLQALSAYRPCGSFAAPAAWHADTGASGLMTPRKAGEFEQYETFVEKSFEAFMKLRDRQGEYGMLNFGDWWGERGFNWGNVEYDTQHVMLMEYLRTLDRKFFDRGCEATLHNRDVDGIHYSENPKAVGTVYAHCMFHTGGYEMRTPDPGLAYAGGGFNRGHVWTRGYFDHYFLTGDRRSLEWALTVSNHLAGPLTVGFSVGNHAERDTAWPIFGVMAAYEATADPYYLNAARIIVEDVIRRQIPETGNWGFPAGYSKVEPKPIGGYAWCCGLLISALDQYNQYVQDPRVNEVIVRAARWLVREEWIVERQGFRATSCPTFDAGTPAGGACWSCSNAMLIAHKLTGEAQFLDIGRRGFALYLQKTQAMGKGVTQSICLGPETVWRFKQLNVTSLDATPYLSPGKAAAPRHLLLWPGEKAVLPVIFRTDRDGKLQAEARAAGVGVTVQPAVRTVEVAGKGQEARVLFEVSAEKPPKPGEGLLTIEAKLGETVEKHKVQVVCLQPAQVGDKVGLIASGEDFLGPALDKLGVRYERLKSLDEAGGYRTLFLGTQAHSIDTLGLKENYWKLFPWIHAGGALFVSQLNDGGWDRFFLPYEVVVDETDGESGAVAEPAHALFNRPRKAAAVSGARMYDTFQVMPHDPWKILMRDAAGGPAIVEAQFGKGRILIMQPSFERFEGEPADGRALFQNAVEYVTKRDAAQ